MDLELGGKSVVICGGAKGIGRACAEAFAKEGARVAIFDWDEEALAEAKSAMGADLITQKVDVSKADEVDAAHAHVIDKVGGIDVGFNNAGVDDEFFPDSSVKSNFICSLGYGDPSGVLARSPRLSFDGACQVV